MIYRSQAIAVTDLKRFIRGEGLIPKNPLTRGSLWGVNKGIKPESNHF